MSGDSPIHPSHSSDPEESPNKSRKRDRDEEEVRDQEEDTEKASGPNGWYPFPSHWTVLEKSDGEIGAVQLIQKDGQQSFMAVENIDCMVEEEGGKRCFFWRNSRLTNPEADLSPFTKIKNMVEAMSALSRLTTGIEKATSVLIEESKHPQIKIQTDSENNLKLPESKSPSDMWAANVNDVLHKKTSADIKVPCSFSIKWPADSTNELLSKFLGAPKLKSEDFNYKLKPFPATLHEQIKKDLKTRKMTNLAFQTNSLIDLMNDQFKAAEELSKLNTKFDSRMVVKLVSEMMAGLSALLKPLTQELIKECATIRTNLRKDCLPTKLTTIKEKFLKGHPFHPAGMGEEEAVCSLIDSVPKPLQVTLPQSLEKAIQQKVPRYDSGLSTSRKQQSYRDKNFNNNYRNKSPEKRQRRNSPDRKNEGNKTTQNKSESFQEPRGYNKPKRGGNSGRGSYQRSKPQ